MARAYDDDLRRKLLEARARGDAGSKKLASRFGVSHSWAQKVVRQSKRSGQAERVRHKPGPRSRMSAEVAAFIRAEVDRTSDLTLAALQGRLLEQQGVRFSIGRLWALLRLLGLRLKKSRSTPGSVTRRRTAKSAGATSTRSARSRRKG